MSCQLPTGKRPIRLAESNVNRRRGDQPWSARRARVAGRVQCHDRGRAPSRHAGKTVHRYPIARRPTWTTLEWRSRDPASTGQGKQHRRRITGSTANPPPIGIRFVTAMDAPGIARRQRVRAVGGPTTRLSGISIASKRSIPRGPASNSMSSVSCSEMSERRSATRDSRPGACSSTSKDQGSAWQRRGTMAAVQRRHLVMNERVDVDTRRASAGRSGNRVQSRTESPATLPPSFSTSCATAAAVPPVASTHPRSAPAVQARSRRVDLQRIGAILQARTRRFRSWPAASLAFGPDESFARAYATPGRR